MTHNEFKKKYPSGSSVASPENTYKGQCVSHVRKYMAEVHDIKTDPLGNAVDFASNPTFLKYYKKVPSPQVGDIMVWGDDPGSWTSIYGHIAVYDGNGYMINQNYGGSLVVSRNKIFSPGFIGYYRKKGTKEVEVIKNKNHVQILFKQFFGRGATASEKKRFAANTLEYLLNNGLFKYRKDLTQVMKERDQLKKENIKLKEQLGTEYVQIVEPVYKKK